MYSRVSHEYYIFECSPEFSENIAIFFMQIHWELTELCFYQFWGQSIKTWHYAVKNFLFWDLWPTFWLVRTIDVTIIIYSLYDLVNSVNSQWICMKKNCNIFRKFGATFKYVILVRYLWVHSCQALPSYESGSLLPVSVRATAAAT